MDVLNPLLELLNGLGTVLDTPGSSVRSLLSGDPSRALSGIMDPSQRVSGRDMLENWGLLGQNQDGLDWGDAAGFGAQMLTDPLVMMGAGPGISRLLGLGGEASTAAKATGVASEALQGAEAASPLARAGSGLFRPTGDLSPQAMSDLVAGAGGAGSRGGEAALDDLLNLEMSNQGVPIQANQLMGDMRAFDLPPGTPPDALAGASGHMALMGSDPNIELQRALADLMPPTPPNTLPSIAPTQPPSWLSRFRRG